MTYTDTKFKWFATSVDILKLLWCGVDTVLEIFTQSSCTFPVPRLGAVSAYTTCKPHLSATEPCPGSPIPSEPGMAKWSNHISQTNWALGLDMFQIS